MKDGNAYRESLRMEGFGRKHAWSRLPSGATRDDFAPSQFTAEEKPGRKVGWSQGQVICASSLSGLSIVVTATQP